MNYGIDNGHSRPCKSGEISVPDIFSFVASMLLTLLLAGFAAGMIYLSRLANSYEADPFTYRDISADVEKILSLRSAVRGVFPYFVLAVDIFLILVRLASIVAEAL